MSSPESLKKVWVQRHDGEAQYSIDHILPVAQANDLDVVNQIHTVMTQWKSDNDEHAAVYLNEYLSIVDPRGDNPKFVTAKMKEITGLQENRVYKVIDKAQFPKRANVLGGRFVLCVKNVGSDDEIYKARYVVQDHKDKEKSRLIHPSTNLRQRSVKLITFLAAVLKFRVWSQDVTQAYLQAEDNLRRLVYVKPTKQFGLQDGQLLQLLKPLYGLSDAGDYWDATMSNHLQKELGMQQASLDISLFYKHDGATIQGISGMYVDDGIHAGNDVFVEECNKTQARFKSKPRNFDNFKFSGMVVSSVEDGIILDQNECAKRIHVLPKKETLKQYRSCRQKLQ